MKKSQQGFIIPLLIIIIAALAIGGGVYEYHKNKEVAQTSVSTAATTTVSTNQLTTQSTSSTTVTTSSKILVPITKVQLKPKVVPPQKTITVISPNGGEKWDAQSVHPITWKYSNMTSSSKVDLYLIDATCWDAPNCTLPEFGPITLDKNIPANAVYNWIVGTDINNNSFTPKTSQIYLLDVCVAGSNLNDPHMVNDCDMSDEPFTIINPAYENNKPPVISSITGPTTLRVGQSGTWVVNAFDPEGQKLSYTFAFMSSNNPGALSYWGNAGQESGNTATGTFNQAGIYTVQVQVFDGVKETLGNLTVNVQ